MIDIGLDPLKSAFGQAGLEFHPRFETQSALSVVAMVAAGLGVGFVTDLSSAQIVTSGVTILTLADVKIGRDVGIVRRTIRSACFEREVSFSFPMT